MTSPQTQSISLLIYGIDKFFSPKQCLRHFGKHFSMSMEKVREIGKLRGKGWYGIRVEGGTQEIEGDRVKQHYMEICEQAKQQGLQEQQQQDELQQQDNIGNQNKAQQSIIAVQQTPKLSCQQPSIEQTRLANRFNTLYCRPLITAHQRKVRAKVLDDKLGRLLEGQWMDARGVLGEDGGADKKGDGVGRKVGKDGQGHQKPHQQTPLQFYTEPPQSTPIQTPIQDIVTPLHRMKYQQQITDKTNRVNRVIEKYNEGYFRDAEVKKRMMDWRKCNNIFGPIIPEQHLSVPSNMIGVSQPLPITPINLQQLNLTPINLQPLKLTTFHQCPIELGRQQYRSKCEFTFGTKQPLDQKQCIWVPRVGELQLKNMLMNGWGGYGSRGQQLSSNLSNPNNPTNPNNQSLRASYPPIIGFNKGSLRNNTCSIDHPYQVKVVTKFMKMVVAIVQQWAKQMWKKWPGLLESYQRHIHSGCFRYLSIRESHRTSQLLVTLVCRTVHLSQQCIDEIKVSLVSRLKEHLLILQGVTFMEYQGDGDCIPQVEVDCGGEGLGHGGPNGTNEIGQSASKMIKGDSEIVNNNPQAAQTKLQATHNTKSNKTTHKLLFGTPYYYEIIHGHKFRVSPSAFLQNHIGMCQLLYKRIVDVIKQCDVVLDLGCGIGTIGVTVMNLGQQRRKTMGDNFEANNQMQVSEGLQASSQIASTIPSLPSPKVIGVELNSQSVSDAKINCPTFDIRLGRVETHIREICQQYRGHRIVAILDPPRSGFSKQVMIALRRCRGLDRIVYIACQLEAVIDNLLELTLPTTNRRKAPAFLVERVEAFDLFPLTEHYQVMVVMERE